ncbi:hypothetical protein C1H76_6993 [Elsinoe australis]|uniref:DUF7730 domain-containing protein n=1 Tax=Elsinoe australis TaxID=40998 RepID=A0A4U7AYG0_9PEZI|nr:hypothetical protein C1H76_6993 [Elsinoe australis]
MGYCYMGGEPRPEDYVPYVPPPNDIRSRFRRWKENQPKKKKERLLRLQLRLSLLRSSSLPVLPKGRKQLLPSSPSSSPSSQPEHSRKSSPLLNLPFEIREQILVAAFGRKQVHLDFDFRYLHLWSGNDDPWNEKLGFRKDRIVATKSEPIQWRWKGAVCWEPENFWEDDCLGRLLGNYQYNPQNIGIMGWLLSCRQAYNEGINILLSTNTIHTRCFDLLINFPSFIRPHYLSMIRSFSMIFTNTQNSYDRQKYGTALQYEDGVLSCPGEVKLFRRITEVLPSHLPNLRVLKWAVSSFFTMTDENRSPQLVAGYLIPPLEQMMRRYGKQLHCTLHVPRDVYTHLYRETRRQQGDSFCHPGRIMQWSFERRIPVTTAEGSQGKLTYRLALGKDGLYNPQKEPCFDAETLVDLVQEARIREFRAQRELEQG